jgi:hypothetical protein
MIICLREKYEIRLFIALCYRLSSKSYIIPLEKCCQMMFKAFAGSAFSAIQYSIGC